MSMEHAKPLPKFLAQRYRGWKATAFDENHTWFERLAAEGQRPRSMIIACCDSRVNVTEMFGAEMGEFFIHRNIANLVPPYKPDGDLHGTSAALEYAVVKLRVANILVLGHSQCGGVSGCLDMCSGSAPEFLDETSFIGRWMDILRESYEAVRTLDSREAQLHALERRAVVTSLENMMTFPFVRDGVAAGDLALHGLHHDIASGRLFCYDPAGKDFVAV